MLYGNSMVQRFVFKILDWFNPKDFSLDNWSDVGWNNVFRSWSWLFRWFAQFAQWLSFGT